MLTNREYISWSQFDLWNKSKREFWKRYGLEEKQLPNRFFDKGKELSEALEYGINDDRDDMLKTVLSIIPKFDIPEQKIEVVLESGIKTLSYIDSGTLDYSEFLEYKTGKIPWTQELVDAHKQLDFYALAYYIKSSRKIIPNCKLIWVETEETEDGIKYTGLVKEFNKIFTINSIRAMEASITKTYLEIEDFEYIETEIDDDLIDRYIDLSAEIKSLTDEKNLIKLEVQVLLEAEETNYGSGFRGRFSFMNRKSWKYSDELIKAAADFNKQLKTAQKGEQSDGTAKCEIKKSLIFKEIKQ